MIAEILETHETIDEAQLMEEGVLYHYIYPRDYQQVLDAWKRERNYTAQDEVKLTPETQDLDEKLEAFTREHYHTDDEVRYVLSGEGIFDVRSRSDKWIRIFVGQGDFIIVPANMYHRFNLTEKKEIHAVRLFKDNPSWIPVYRDRFIIDWF